MALTYLKTHLSCRYIFLSSGAAYGSSYEVPVDGDSKASIAINDIQPQDWYGAAKLHAECRHRSHTYHPIIDIRLFNYFSHTQNMSARFLMTDAVRAISTNTLLLTSPEQSFRDYIHPIDFCQLVIALLNAPEINTVVDSYSLAPIDKLTLLTTMQEKFGLKYEMTKASIAINATGIKKNYYSLNRRAADFGFKPTLTSLAGVLIESEKALARHWPLI